MLQWNESITHSTVKYYFLQIKKIYINFSAVQYPTKYAARRTTRLVASKKFA